jgi:type IX secretion system substrate protein
MSIMSRSLTIASILACSSAIAMLFAQTPERFVIPLTAHDAALNRSQTIYFGLDPSATICIDTGLGEFGLPPVPPGFEVRFLNPGGSAQQCPTSPGIFSWGLGSWRDIRSSDPGTTVDTFVVQMTYGADASAGDTVTWSWPDLGTYYTGNVSLAYFGFDETCTGHAVEVDMKATQSVSFFYSPDCGGPTKFRMFAHRTKTGGVLGVGGEGNRVPPSFSLRQNYPNPFNPTTTFTFSLAGPSDVTLKVYNVLGMEVASLVSEHLPAGNFTVVWDAREITSGIYFYALRAGSFSATRKLAIVK